MFWKGLSNYHDLATKEPKGTEEASKRPPVQECILPHVLLPHISGLRFLFWVIAARFYSAMGLISMLSLLGIAKGTGIVFIGTIIGMLLGFVGRVVIVRYTT